MKNHQGKDQEPTKRHKRCVTCDVGDGQKLCDDKESYRDRSHREKKTSLERKAKLTSEGREAWSSECVKS